MLPSGAFGNFFSPCFRSLRLFSCENDVSDVYCVYISIYTYAIHIHRASAPVYIDGEKEEIQRRQGILNFQDYIGGDSAPGICIPRDLMRARERESESRSREGGGEKKESERARAK